MPDRMTDHLTYLRFLNLVRAAGELPGAPRLSSGEEQLLEELAGYWHRGETLTVLKAMAMAQDSSLSTTHRRLNALRNKGMIEFSRDKVDQRIKHVLPTEICLDYFRHLSSLMHQAYKQSVAQGCSKK